MTAHLRTPKNFASPYDITSLPAHFAARIVTPCVCAHIVSKLDGSVIGITSWSHDLTSVPGYVGVTFKRSAGLMGSNVESQQGQAATNMEASALILSTLLSEADVLAGKWTGALVTVFVTNYEAVKMGQYVVQRGEAGQLTQKGQLLTVEILGWNAKLLQQYGQVTKNQCTRRFCDDWCTLDVADFTVTGTLTGVTSQTVFADSSRTEPDDRFGNGEFQFTSGDNDGYLFKIDAYTGTGGIFTLRTAAPYLPQVGDTYSAVYGCRKRPTDCHNRVKVDTSIVDNYVNNDIFEFIPTAENLFRLPLQ